MRPDAAAAPAPGEEPFDEYAVVPFPRVKERDVWRRLGVSKEASYEEIQEARKWEWEAQHERRRRAQQRRRHPKRATAMSDLMEVLDCEREYRERILLRRKCMNQGITRKLNCNLVSKEGVTLPGEQKSMRAVRRHTGYNKGSATKVTARCLSLDVKEGLQLMTICGKCLC